MKCDISGQKGFTLLELLIAMAVASIVGLAMFGFQQGQTRSYVTQEVVTGMQQNARSAMQFMTSEIRMAGCDPNGNANARILEASSNHIRFSMDFSSPPVTPGDFLTVPVIEVDFEEIDNTMYVLGVPDGTTNQRGENLTYQLDADGNIIRIDHNNSNTAAIIAENIDALDFVYLDENGDRIGAFNDVLGPNARAQIRSIQVTTLARAWQAGFMYRHTDTMAYTNPEGDALLNPNPPNDDFRRILLSSEVMLRNM